MIPSNPMLNSIFEAFSAHAPVFIGFLALAVILSILGKVLANLFQPKFTARPILNKSEQRVFNILQQVKPQNQHLFAQVSYGEFLQCASNRKFWTINAKRADFVLCNEQYDVVAVIEYQGSGHFGSTGKSKENAKQRDAAKRRALKEAGIPLVEIPAKFDKALVAQLIDPQPYTKQEGSAERVEPTFSDVPRATKGTSINSPNPSL